jgi:hypothetical protein
MGRSLTAAGELVSQADPDTGAILIKAGTAIDGEAPYAEETVRDLREGNIYSAARDETNQYVDPIKSAVLNAQSAVRDAVSGKMDQATLEAATALVLSEPDQQNVDDAKQAVIAAETALDDAKVALSQGNQGNFGTAAEKLGDALSSASKAMQSTDKSDGDELADLGNQIHEAAAHGKEATEAEKQTITAVKQASATSNTH